MTADEDPFRRLHEALRSRSDEITRIFADGDIALFFFEVGQGAFDPATKKRSEDGARAMGWRGSAIEVSRMTKTHAARLADAIAQIAPGDAAIAWLRRRHGDRIYVCAHAGTLCMDVGMDGTIQLAPGTTDGERLQ
ncbi:MAG: hypothetical protein JOZ69_15895 [Myxococcales bacterium]|nr:hypothetical protein [Myxococcales bacterium]